jgi:hypothetical protein
VVVPQILVPEDDPLLLAQEEEENACFIAVMEEYEVDGCSCINNNKTTFWLKYT